MSKLVNTVYTIGHSTRTIDDFIKLIKAYRIEMIVDVRTIAGSEYNPQYNEESLKNSLGKYNISYMRMKGLGGLRHTTKESINTAWKNLSFRGYADYMQKPEFTQDIDQLIKLVKEKYVAIMCAEAVPWRCHRSLIGDALVIRDMRVIDIINEKNNNPHKITPFAQVKGQTITYPEEAS
jgi:uncharacterized protein (DUF488 family)